MRKVLKWILILIAAVLGLALLAVGGLYVISEQRLQTVYDVTPEPIAIPTDPAAIARGQHLVDAVGLCRECHGPTLSGSVLDEGPMVVRLPFANLTSGKGGVGATFTDADWVRAIRHGIDPEGKSLILMSSPIYYNFSDEDLGAIIAYLKTLPPLDNEMPEKSLGPMGRFFLMQEPMLISASTIDHEKPHEITAQPGVTQEYGRYLVTLTCTSCHGEDLAGIEGEGGGLNLTPGGDLGQWSEEDFIKTLRTGVAPDGKQLDEEMMPLLLVRNMTDDELRAIWLYLQSVPAIVTPEGTSTD